MSLEPPKANEYVLAGGLCYPLETWFATTNEAGFQLLEERIPEGSSLRRIARVLRDAKTKPMLEAVWRRTVKLLDGEGVAPPDVLSQGGEIVGVIPLDKTSAPQ